MSIEQLNLLLDNGLDVYKYYISPQVKLSTNMISPFPRPSGEMERHASFQIFRAKSGLICFKDHASEKKGTHWDFVMALYGVDFSDALSLVKRDILGITDYRSEQALEKRQVMSYATMNQVIVSTPVEISTTRREVSKGDRELWGRYGVIDLALFHVYPVSDVRFCKSGKIWSWKSSDNDPIYEIAFPSGRKKIYRPLTLNRKQKWISNVVAEEDIFCFHLLPERADKLFITAGNKDTMSFHSTTGLYGVPLNSESATLSMEFYSLLSLITDRIYSIGNTDRQGDIFTEKLQRDYGIRPARELLEEGGFKDYAEMIEASLSSEEHMRHIRSYYQRL